MTSVKAERLSVLLDGFPVEGVFLHQHAGGKRIGVIVRHHRHLRLRQDATAVDFFAHEMHRRAGFRFMRSKHGFVNVMPPKALAAKLRQQRWMDVQNALTLCRAL